MQRRDHKVLEHQREDVDEKQNEDRQNEYIEQILNQESVEVIELLIKLCGHLYA